MKKTNFSNKVMALLVVTAMVLSLIPVTDVDAKTEKTVIRTGPFVTTEYYVDAQGLKHERITKRWSIKTIIKTTTKTSSKSGGKSKSSSSTKKSKKTTSWSKKVASKSKSAYASLLKYLKKYGYTGTYQLNKYNSKAATATIIFKNGPGTKSFTFIQHVSRKKKKLSVWYSQTTNKTKFSAKDIKGALNDVQFRT